jgi:BirA family biotin operon repressor/biotin-[acetyl-CoA-carboxylase] ligase
VSTARPDAQPDELPIDADALRARLVAPHGPYAGLNVVASTGSTNADLAAAGQQPDRTVLIAEQQTAGQGRQRRSWVSPAGSGLYLSVLLRPSDVPVERLGWIPLLAGVALARTVTWAGADTTLKWPNDLLVGAGHRKAAGILAEVSAVRDNTVVLGIGLNVLPLPADVPVGAGGLAPTSLADERATQLDRTELAAHLLTQLAELELAWRAAGGDPVATGLAAEYRRWCGTLGQRVRVELPGPAELVGVAETLDADGTLVVRADDGRRHPVSAGDVVHLRPAS